MLYIRPHSVDGKLKQIDIVDKDNKIFLFSEKEKDEILWHFANRTLIIKSVGYSSNFCLQAITISSNREIPYMIFTFISDDKSRKIYKTKIFSK